MGYTYEKHNHGTIKNYWPDDTDKIIYLSSDMTGINMLDIISAIEKKWPGKPLSDFDISAEHIHTACIGYDMYDPSDYTNFIVITYIGE